MKNYFLKLTLFAVFFNFFSCTSFLEEDVESYYNEEQIFSSNEGIEAAVNGLYQRFADPAYYGTAMHTFINPISGRFYSNQTASIDANSLNCTPTNTWLTRMWPSMYAAINTSNIVIDGVQNNGKELERENWALGHAYLIRAATYFDLVRLFGSVPMRLEPTNVNNLDKPKSSKQEIYEQIIADLEMAGDLLPETESTASGKPLKWAAYMYLAKVYMTMAGEDGGNPVYWQNAWDEAIKVYGKYSLTPSYNTLFTLGTENTSEAIFELQYSHIGAERNSDRPRSYTPQNSTFVGNGITVFGRIRANKEVFDSHRSQYPTDPRINGTFVHTSYVKATGGNQTIYPTVTTGTNSFVFIKKWFDSSYTGSTTQRNHIVLRYADLLLMLAEIENELHGPTNAYQYVNQVLLRARNTTTPAAVDPMDWSGMTQDQFRIRIMQERQYELLAEGHDWFDTRRRGYQFLLDHVINKHNNHLPFATGFDFVYPINTKNMLLPIPSDELNANHALSVNDQNPGY
jgi:hypothetical protein